MSESLFLYTDFEKYVYFFIFILRNVCIPAFSYTCIMISKFFSSQFVLKVCKSFLLLDECYKNRGNLIIEINQAHVINVYFKRNRLVVMYSTNVRRHSFHER